VGQHGCVYERHRIVARHVDGLRSLGYTVGTSEIGSVQAVVVEPKTGKQYGAADSRREGTAIGLPRPQSSRALEEAR